MYRHSNFIVLWLFCINMASSQKVFYGGANNTSLYFDLIRGKSLGIVAHQCSVVFGEKDTVHLVDYLKNKGFTIQKIFAPEHGFRGGQDAAKPIKNNWDIRTNLPIISLYGKGKKPTPQHLEGIEVMLFDLQDVGVRFYTYLSTLHYVMEACAERSIPLIVLDRPNPNASYIAGPVLQIKYRSFVGMHPVPVIYGMTIGEYAQMINGEGWLKNRAFCKLTVIPMENYRHSDKVHLPIKPSPNLPNDKAIKLYPSLGFFEGTTISVGRGTDFPFQCYGSPYLKKNFTYMPTSKPGAMNPKYKGKVCYGVDLRHINAPPMLNIQWLYDAYHNTPKNQKFFGKTFTAHAGSPELQRQLEKGFTPEKIRDSHQKSIKNFSVIRQKYLLYK